jgi:hypothetical protein
VGGGRPEPRGRGAADPVRPAGARSARYHDRLGRQSRSCARCTRSPVSSSAAETRRPWRPPRAAAPIGSAAAAGAVVDVGGDLPLWSAGPTRRSAPRTGRGRGLAVPGLRDGTGWAYRSHSRPAPSFPLCTESACSGASLSWTPRRQTPTRRSCSRCWRARSRRPCTRCPGPGAAPRRAALHRGAHDLDDRPRLPNPMTAMRATPPCWTRPSCPARGRRSTPAS